MNKEDSMYKVDVTIDKCTGDLEGSDLLQETKQHLDAEESTRKSSCACTSVNDKSVNDGRA